MAAVIILLNSSQFSFINQVETVVKSYKELSYRYFIILRRVEFLIPMLLMPCQLTVFLWRNSPLVILFSINLILFMFVCLFKKIKETRSSFHVFCRRNIMIKCSVKCQSLINPNLRNSN